MKPIDFKPAPAHANPHEPIDFRTAVKVTATGYEARQVAQGPNWCLVPGPTGRGLTRLFPTLRDLELFIWRAA